MYTLGVDVGGTFTDFTLASVVDGELTVEKEPTTPENPATGVLRGLRRLLDSQRIGFDEIESVVHGTTLVSNTLIEQTGAPTGLLTTAGMGGGVSGHRGYRYDMFDWGIEYPDPLVPRHRQLEVKERLDADGSVLTPLDVDQARTQVRTLLEDHDVSSIAVSFLHAYENGDHERKVAEIIAEESDVPVSLSSVVVPVIRETERTSTTVINAYVSPVVSEYLDHLIAELDAEGFTGELYVMTSSGGVIDVETAKAEPVRLIESGPAAGVLTSRMIGERNKSTDVFSFDMGGTTAKGSVVRRGEIQERYQTDVAREHRFKEGSGYPVLTPLIDLTEIGAGGGSIAWINDVGLVEVGPESAGSDPGPVCYDRGGERPTLTDATLLLGYLDAGAFYGGRMELAEETARTVFQQTLADPLERTVTEAAWHVFEVVNENMATAFREYATRRGIDVRDLDMVTLGGAGPSHAFRVARKLNIERVVCPFGAGVGSSIGLTQAPRMYEASASNQDVLALLDGETMREQFEDLRSEAMAVLARVDLDPEDTRTELSLDMRHVDQGHEFSVPLDVDIDQVSVELASERFAETYREKFNRDPLEFPVEVLTYRLELCERTESTVDGTLSVQPTDAQPRPARKVYFGPDTGSLETDVYRWSGLDPGTAIQGPAIVEADQTTVVADPAATMHVTDEADIKMEL